MLVVRAPPWQWPASHCHAITTLRRHLLFIYRPLKRPLQVTASLLEAGCYRYTAYSALPSPRYHIISRPRSRRHAGQPILSRRLLDTEMITYCAEEIMAICREPRHTRRDMLTIIFAIHYDIERTLFTPLRFRFASSILRLLFSLIFYARAERHAMSGRGGAFASDMPHTIHMITLFSIRLFRHAILSMLYASRRYGFRQMMI